MGREKEASLEQRAALHQLVMDPVADAKKKSADELRELESQLEALRKTHEPLTPEMARYLIRRKVNDGLYHFPVTLRLDADAPTGLRPALHATSSVLSEVYLELAWEVSGSGSITFCSECARPYQPQRKPKSGQANFCPGCRKASVPQRLHMRRGRAKA